MTSLQKVSKQVEHAGFEFLITDSDTALTLCRIAFDAGDDLEKRSRNQQNARNAYETIIRLSAKRTFTEEENGELTKKLREVRTELEKLGEVFDTAV